MLCFSCDVWMYGRPSAQRQREREKKEKKTKRTRKQLSRDTTPSGDAEKQTPSVEFKIGYVVMTKASKNKSSYGKEARVEGILSPQSAPEWTGRRRNYSRVMKRSY